MTGKIRYFWNWLFAQVDVLTIVGSLVFGMAGGILLMEFRHDAIDSSFLASLQAECHAYLGQNSVLTYRNGYFGCMPGRGK